VGDNTTSTRLAVVLKSLKLPDDTYFRMTAENDDDDPAYGTTGGLTRLELPTLGSIEWQYGTLDMHEGSWSRPSTASPKPLPPAVSTRTLRNGENAGTWTYDRVVSNGNIHCSCQQSGFGCDAYPRQLTTFTTAPDNVTGISYFSIFTSADPCAGDGWTDLDYGLPFTRAATTGSPFLSGERRSAAVVLGSWSWWGAVPAPSSDELWQREYVVYDRDSGSFSGSENLTAAENRQRNVRAGYSKKTDDGNSACSGCYSDVSFFGYDGFGHFEQTSTNSNIPGTRKRTTFVDHPGSLDAAQHWVLNTPAESCVVDEDTARTALIAPAACPSLSGAAITKWQYDRATGALMGRRVLSGSTAAGSDLLALFQYENGNLKKEQYFGGDAYPHLGLTDLFAPPASPWSSNPTYEINHALTYGPLGLRSARRSTCKNFLTGADFAASFEDLTYDLSTGLMWKSRESAGLETTYLYDTSGRLTHVLPPSGLASTSLAHTPASMSETSYTPAQITVTTTSSTAGTVKKEYRYDRLGRLWREQTLMPGGSFAQVETLYNAAGQVVSVSTQQPATSFDATKKTQYLYDATGKPRSITAPDGGTTTITRRGSTSIQTVVKKGGVTSSDRTETYDGLGHLHRVKEPSGPTSASQTSGADVETTYGYDRDRLTSVSMSSPPGTTPLQSRSFTYDLRGLLTSESHPESGTTSYRDFDARGHALRRIAGPENGIFDLTFEYDSAERLRVVRDLASGTRRTLKEFVYADANGVVGGATNYQRGKLLTATRANHLQSGEAVSVAETYSYVNPAGAVSNKETSVFVNSALVQTFSQSYVRDDLGGIKQVNYPACAPFAPCPSAGALTGVSRSFTNGWLTAVGSYGTISYHANGLIDTITHPGSVTDTHARDDDWLPRPKSITFAGYSTAACSYALQPGTATFFNNAATGAVNIISSAGCAWTASTNSGFLAITGGASGTGSGTVTYSVAQNTGLSRSGTLTIAGQTFTVHQRSFAPVRGDLNLDGNVDVLWRNAITGENVVWYLSNNVYLGGAAMPSLDTAWKMAGAADFNQDGLTDLVFRNSTTGANTVWFMNGTTLAGSGNLQTVSDPNWTLEAIGDFNGDAHPDIVWHNHASGLLVIWRMNGLAIASAAELGIVADLNWHVVGAADFNADGQTDLAWRHATNGANVFWRMNGTSLVNGVEVDGLPDNNWKIVAVGDYTGEGQPDLFWHNMANGANAVWKISNFAYAGGLEVDGLPDLRWVAGGPR
jgi:YD repeat-containing protein